jgi:hypothetical protein
MKLSDEVFLYDYQIDEQRRKFSSGELGIVMIGTVTIEPTIALMTSEPCMVIDMTENINEILDENMSPPGINYFSFKHNGEYWNTNRVYYKVFIMNLHFIGWIDSATLANITDDVLDFCLARR